jgi:hypothetical protein
MWHGAIASPCQAFPSLQTPEKKSDIANCNKVAELAGLNPLQ